MYELKITVSADKDLLRVLSGLSDSILAASTVLEVRTDNRTKTDNTAVSTPAQAAPQQTVSVNVPPITAQPHSVQQPTQPVTYAVPQINPVPQPQAVPQPAPQTTYTAPIQTAPTAQPMEYTLEQLSLAAVSLMDANKTAELTSVLQALGVQSLPQLPKEKYNDFAVAIRGLGAQI